MIVPQQYFKHFFQVRKIQYGPYKTSIECLTHQKNERTLYISSALKSKINLSTHKQLTLLINDDTCIITLTMGVFLAGFNNTDPLGERTKIFERMSEAGDTLGFRTIFFGHQHVLKNKRKINAYYFEDRQWKRDIFDFPSVVYNRIPNRKIESHPEVMETKKKLNNHASYFNQSFFNKWEVYDILMRNSECSYLLPETILHPSKQKIINLLSNFAVYIKPIHGSRGDGIVKCTKLHSNEIECLYYDKDKPQINRYTNIDSLFAQLFPNGLKGYVVQEAIPLIKKGKSSIDFRVHTNKNHRNSWEVTLIGAKFAGKGSLTTHVQRGGSVHEVDELFPKEQANHIIKKLSNTALFLSTCLETRVPDPVGEIGFDLGVDEEGKVWLFEANSKPGFSIFNHPEIYKKSPKVLAYPYKYAFYLHNTLMNKLV
ncbi:YheC/YheD family endospore coat-associated protein [Aquibacillus rhizosphaerae]|uniref:YheC/YheD family protein n=1 Tax=Aquibacillus rhizosphaerae TaxID=3051431 RepID=A0ABT7LBS6_9BACI|nr:YheC/YheD family protein [Aquibacillus sp. LR5S19]MDL4842737.1 YheC/YheD family protein [Aquibacillus sp. LR5S19]